MRISDWSSDVCSSDLFALTFGLQIGSRAVRPEGAKPAQGVIPFGGAVGRKADDFGASGDRVEGDGAAESLLAGVDAAVCAAVAVVAHQEQMVRGHGDGEIGRAHV